MAVPGHQDVGNGQRAFWMLLFYMLIGPVLGGLAGAALFAGGAIFGVAPEPFYGKPFADVAPNIVPIGIMALVWSVIPSVFTAVGLFPTVLKSGTVGFLMAAAVGVIAFTAAILIFPFPTGGVQPLIAFIAGCIAVACRALLLRGGIIKREVETPDSDRH